jgi:hypothetical protein
METAEEKRATFTPGPWVAMGKAVYTESDNPTREILWGGHNTRSASDEEKRANARLIAAAPAMYETMKAILAVVNDPGPIFPGTAIGDKLREVLAKVEGGEG